MIPGLLKQVIVSERGEYVEVLQVWDLEAPNCPMMLFDKTVWPWKRRTDATVKKTIRMHREEAAKLLITIDAG